jgi:hypothetical protein
MSLKKPKISKYICIGFVYAVPGTRLGVLASVVNDLLKEVEQIFKQHGDCGHCFCVYLEFRYVYVHLHLSWGNLEKHCLCMCSDLPVPRLSHHHHHHEIL